MRSGESVEPSARVIQVELPYPVTKKPRAPNQACVFSMCTQRHLVQKGGARRPEGLSPCLLWKPQTRSPRLARMKRAVPAGNERCSNGDALRAMLGTA